MTQTSHDTDMVIREFVTRDPGTADALRRWMVRAPSPVLRVNSAGVLAKVGGGLEDEVVRMLKGDADSRHLYLTAVASRVLELPWRRAADLASAVNQGSAAGLWQQPREQVARAAARRRRSVVQRPDARPGPRRHSGHRRPSTTRSFPAGAWR